MIHLTVSAPMRTPQRLLDLVNQRDRAVERAHTQPLSGRMGQNTCPYPQAAGTSLDMANMSRSRERDGHCAQLGLLSVNLLLHRACSADEISSKHCVALH